MKNVPYPCTYRNYTENDRFHDTCGIFGIFHHEKSIRLTYLGLYALQHRGQESAGICSSNHRHLFQEKGMGYVSDVFTPERLKLLQGDSAIGHVRYSTAGESKLANAQPIVTETHLGPLALCHNGNIANAEQLRQELIAQHDSFFTSSDSEIILKRIGHAYQGSLDEALEEAVGPLRGAFSLLLLTRDEIVAVRDPYGFRPLCIGYLDGSYVFASETSAFDLIGAKYLEDVAPGEIVRCDSSGLHRRKYSSQDWYSQCVFEHIYFARPDSLVFKRNVNQVRYELGRQMAREFPLQADVVVPVPDSGVSAALGFSAESGVRFDFGMIRNHYIGRTFIQPVQAMREFGVRVKLNPVKEILEGKDVVLVDDSIVRGTTSREICSMVRSAGARRIYLCISSPPIISPCFFGIDTPTQRELIAASQTIAEIEAYLGVDSLHYLSHSGLLTCMNDTAERLYCTSCFTGKYPVGLSEVLTTSNGATPCKRSCSP